MTFNKKLVAGAVGTALTLGLGMQVAQAGHDMLFPYVVKDANRTTLITIIGNGQPVASGAGMHLQYWTKSTTDANTAACQPSSTTLTFTANDIVTFDTAGILGSGPLFGDTTNVAALGTSIAYAAPRHGYLVVDNDDSNLYRGYWLELDLANGGAHGDMSILNITASTDDFTATSDNVALYPGNVGNGDGGPAAAVPFWPTSVASTTFTITPLGTNMRTSENNNVVMQVRNTSNVQGAYDRNENGVDGTVPQTVRCVGRLTAAQLMPGVVANAAWAATGGWGFLTNLGNGNSTFVENCAGGTGDCRAIVYQVDTSSAAGAGKFMDNAMRIVSDPN